jgi:hypothetical protein
VPKPGLTALVPIPAKHLVRRVLRRPPATARRYLRRGVTVDSFLGGLTDAGVRYAVLRWFQDLPAVEPGNDIDVLVADEDLPFAESLLTPYRPFRNVQKVDLYTAGGLPRTTFGGVPYLPAGLAARVLDRAVLVQDRYKVPSPVDHLDSLAFHAVYHKGEASGLPGDGSTTSATHGRIGSTIERLSRELSRELEVSLAGLEGYLAREGLSPPADTVEPLAAERRRLYPS